MPQRRCKKQLELHFETLQVTKIFLNHIYILFFSPVHLHSNLISDFSYFKYFVWNLGFQK
jgi:hypothetical protein